jgi:translation initiation factor IF-2
MALQVRPPIITILGHVDHGKTSLLDYIRKTRVQQGEFGGITQHIGAYQVEYQGHPLTFIDTPGHAAFSKMRSRGAAVTDIVVLVVAADDGVKPQTIESIQHIKKSNVPFLVAINKMDAPGASAEMVKAQLTEHEVFISGYGGDTEAVEISAKTGMGVDNLLETLVTFGEILELKADPDAPLQGVVIESSKDKFLGPVGTVLVRNGTLRNKAQIWADKVDGQVRTLINDVGVKVEAVGPGEPAQVTGFNAVPVVGSVVTSVAPEREDKVIDRLSLSHMLSNLEDEPKLKFILKADTAGTLEAIRQNIPSENVEFIEGGVGDISESDITLAETTGAAILAFQVKVPNPMLKLAKRFGVKVYQYKIIYKLLEEVQERILRLLEPSLAEISLAKVEVLQLFNIRGEQILGCRVKEGILRKGQQFHLHRGENIVTDGTISSLKQGKTDVDSVETDQECGVVLTQRIPIQVGDILETFKPLDD